MKGQGAPSRATPASTASCTRTARRSTTKQKPLFEDVGVVARREKARLAQELQVISCPQPQASLLACGGQWVWVSPMKLGAGEIALLAKWPPPLRLRHECRRLKARLEEAGLRRYEDLPRDAFVAVGQIVSGRKIRSRSADPEFWRTVDSQLDLVGEMRLGDFAYRLELRGIDPVPFVTPWQTFKITRATVEGGNHV